MGKSLKIKPVFFWIITALLAFELIDGALWDFNVLNKGMIQGVLARLGYPGYLAFILGSAKIPAAIVLLLPRLQLLKEWAYAGLCFLFTGAVVSHIVAKEYTAALFPLVFLPLTLLSWWLRPASGKVILPAG